MGAGSTPSGSTATAVKQTEGAQPGELAPQVAKKRPPKVEKTKPTRKLREGDLVCGECGEGNLATRKFCSRCGNSLATAVTVKVPWWKKIIPRRKRKVLEAGARPGQAGVKAKKKKGRFKPIIRKVRLVLGIVLVLATIGYGTDLPKGFQQWVNNRYTSVKDSVLSVIRPEYSQVRAIDVDDNTADVVDHEPLKAIDDFFNTHWVAPVGSVDPTLTIFFDRPFDLHKIIIRGGASENFAQSNRPKTIHLVFSNLRSQDITLDDKGEPQTVNIRNAGNIDSVEFHIVDVYRPASAAESETAITEIEFFTKK